MKSNPLLKGSLQTIILKLLEDNDQMYGYEITQKVKEVSEGGLMLTEGALYPALHKLEADGYVETFTQVVDNRVRKYYSLTEQGGKEVTSKLAEAQAFIDQLQTLLNLNPATK
ncbi:MULTISPECIES: PadR family transcriptional regulator [unclassified Mucilaginibacter]|uniref:PadR family transcriptional regulator n=1 Tax=unclassified Mucilaginibacter TaxID=2617802 RepID=UPI00138BA761|nr:MULTISPECIES: PadR family transcriptional regulator [unclassified Mucilaginibacter]MBB5396031.1 DNA-binding PadR family transcriptional regulator [Mucilaginibacter sp. AK015]QHS54253.1 PadR family transcriptional regulator [Mucilaginibacter sp. 14171R-50]